MKTQCSVCSMPYDGYIGDFLKCFPCNQKESKKMIKHINRPKIVQNNRTKHLSKEIKDDIAKYILKITQCNLSFTDEDGMLIPAKLSYRDSVPFICQKFSVEIDFGGVRAIVNSKYFQDLAFKDEEEALQS